MELRIFGVFPGSFFAEAKNVGLGGMMTLLVGFDCVGISFSPTLFGVALGVCGFLLLCGVSTADLVNSVSS